MWYCKALPECWFVVCWLVWGCVCLVLFVCLGLLLMLLFYYSSSLKHILSFCSVSTLPHPSFCFDSFSSCCAKADSLPINRQRSHCPSPLAGEDFFFLSFLPLKRFLCWLQRNDFPNGGFISTPLPLIFFGSRISLALILWGFSVPFIPCSVGLDSFLTTNTEPVEKLQAPDLTLWNLLCLMGFLQGGLLKAFCLLFLLQHRWVKMLLERHFQAARSILFPWL